MTLTLGCSFGALRRRAVANRTDAFIEREIRLWGALLHKSPDCRTSPIPGQTYPTTSVTGMPRVVKPFRTATLTWNSAT